MTWTTLKGIRQATRMEFAPWLAARHHFVQLPSGRWCRTLGPPDLRDNRLRQLARNVWRMEVEA